MTVVVTGAGFCCAGAGVLRGGLRSRSRGWRGLRRGLRAREARQEAAGSKETPAASAVARRGGGTDDEMAGDDGGCLHGTPSFQCILKQRSLRREVREELAARLEKTSHAGIIRIGFEGISQPHNAWSTPVSITRLKHSRRGLANRRHARYDSARFSRLGRRYPPWPIWTARRLERPMPATVALERTSSMACWASDPDRMRGAARFPRAGPAGNHADVEANRRRRWPRSRRASMPRGRAAVMRNPPDCPRREEMNPARARACKTLERKLSGAPVARASAGSETRPRPAARPTESSRGRHNRRRASVASRNWVSSSHCPAEGICVLDAATAGNASPGQNESQANGQRNSIVTGVCIPRHRPLVRSGL